MAGELRIRVAGLDDLASLADRLRRADVGAVAERELRGEGDPVVSQIRSRVRSIDIGSSRDGTSRTNRSTGLRDRLALATRSKNIPGGIRFEVVGAEVDPTWGWRLAKLTDTELARRWRHPVFYSEDREENAWTGQTGQPWFFISVRAATPRFDIAARRALDRVAQQITGGS